uniref:Geranylgeranyl transferase type-2 subunit alpha n=1 Tax=Meloidogyne hapla TaxID=6305 RepID=A0A1I8B980_MELHA
MMHFVKKSQVSEGEKTAYEKKRAAKLERFVQMKERIFEKRKIGEYDEEIMELTAELLGKHADIYTFWNIRREAIERICVKLEGESEKENIERKSKLLDKELKLTQECLMKNPKSYSSWHHRFLVVSQRPKINFQEELALCDNALALDCRNFHCWGKFFSDRLIGKNPSNYSAWHYRGTLLPRLEENRKEISEGRLLTDECLKGEFEKVLHVCGVNSEDQTAWTYCRWLVELATNGLPNSPQIVAARFLDSTTVLVVFSEAVNKQVVKNSFNLFDYSKIMKFESFSPFKTSDFVSEFKYSHVWLLSNVSSPLLICPLNQEGKDEAEIKQIEIDKIFVDGFYFQKNFTSSAINVRELPRKCLDDLIKLCNDLIPVEDNPWALAALTRAMFYLKGINKQTFELAKDNCEKLKKIDFQRSEMYEELMDKYRLIKSLNEESSPAGGTLLSKLIEGNRQLNLKEIGLKSLDNIPLLSAFVSTDNLINDNLMALKNLTLDGNPTKEESK